MIYFNYSMLFVRGCGRTFDKLVRFDMRPKLLWGRLRAKLLWGEARRGGLQLKFLEDELRARMWQHLWCGLVSGQIYCGVGRARVWHNMRGGCGLRFQAHPVRLCAHKPKHMYLSGHFGSCIKDWLLCFITFGNSCYHDCYIRTCKEWTLLVLHLKTFLM